MQRSRNKLGQTRGFGSNNIFKPGTQDIWFYLQAAKVGSYSNLFGKATEVKGCASKKTEKNPLFANSSMMQKVNHLDKLSGNSEVLTNLSTQFIQTASLCSIN
jgi:hypothetical protein